MAALNGAIEVKLSRRQFVSSAPGVLGLLDLVSHEGIPVLTPAQFLQRLRESEA